MSIIEDTLEIHRLREIANRRERERDAALARAEKAERELAELRAAGRAYFAPQDAIAANTVAYEAWTDAGLPESGPVHDALVKASNELRAIERMHPAVREGSRKLLRALIGYAPTTKGQR
jgi:hypothetical protein